ncbi:MAG: sulfatase [Salinibacter sp.]|uniref:sulfatase n=1 Tax=Salinibacter sp. TaxID=2065818 RepID=UPI0035D43E8A
MQRRQFLQTLLGLAGTGVAGVRPGRGSGPDRLNVVLILVDDLGWRDLGCYGSDAYDTPNLDRLADQGTRFTNAYAAAPNCSPSRASLLTGQAPARLHLTTYLPGRDVPHAPLRPPDMRDHLPHEVRTVAERLGARGYATASIGKWHLGGPGSLPTDHGFDVGFGGSGRGHQQGMFAPYGVPDVEARPGEYLTDRLNRRARRFIETHRNQPFFLYLPHYAVHRPHEGKEALVQKYRDRLGPGHEERAAYAAMIESIDRSTGRIVDTLRRHDIFENTLLLFTSENGPTDVSPPRPLRAGKGTIYEGGIRVPCIAAGAGVARQTVDTPIIGHDLAATILAAAGAQPQGLDGANLRSLLGGAAMDRPRTLHWHFPHYSWRDQRPAGAIRHGRYKLIDYYHCDERELYDLKTDPGERHNLAARQTERTDRLQRRLAHWREQVGAQMPTPNPQHDPEKSSVPACGAQ